MQPKKHNKATLRYLLKNNVAGQYLSNGDAKLVNDYISNTELAPDKTEVAEKLVKQILPHVWDGRTLVNFFYLNPKA